MSILQTIHLKKYYGTGANITRALDDVSLTDGTGGICGRSGYFRQW